MRVHRLFEIMYILLNKNHVSAKDLAKRFEVSVRTIYRDIDILSYAGIPVYAAQGYGGGIFIDEDYVLNKSMLSKEEQEQILISLQCLAPLDEFHTENILTRLSAVFDKKRDWVHVDYSRWNNKTDSVIFESLKKSILCHNAVFIHYMSSYGELTKRTIYPLRLVFKSKAWYVQSYCKAKKSYRLFRLSRIIFLEKRSELFEADAYMQDIPDQHELDGTKISTHLKLRFSQNVAYRLYDEFPAEAISWNPDHSCTVIVDLPCDFWLYGFLLSFGAEVEILKPECLKKDLADKAYAIYLHHNK